MWGMSPWGGRGANPLPQRFQTLWNSVGTKLSGGFPYSEGIFEDMNKAIFSQFYWKRDTPAIDTVRQYASYEFSPGVADDVVHAVNILEQNHTLPAADAGSADALDRLQKADARLSRQARASWRWRILLLWAARPGTLRAGRPANRGRGGCLAGANRPVPCAEGGTRGPSATVGGAAAKGAAR